MSPPGGARRNCSRRCRERAATSAIVFDSANFQANESTLTLQHLALKNGKATPTEAIPNAPAPCPQGWNDGEGGALYMRDGNLTVIDSTFSDNQAAPSARTQAAVRSTFWAVNTAR